MKSKIIIGLIVTLISIYSNGQQDAQYTQYMYNTLAINPAYAGSRGVLSLAGLYRSQWIGLDGAPVTQTFNIHSPIGNRIGLGLSIVNDEIGNGTNQETYFDGSFSYTIPVSDKGNLSFGLKAGGNLLNIDLSRLRTIDTSINSGTEVVVDNRFSPNFGFGIYYYTQKFYLGLSAPNILETEYFDTSGQNQNLIAEERLNYYLITGLVLDIYDYYKFKPALLLKGVAGAPLQIDISANFMYRNKFTLGAAYRWDAAWSALAGFQLSTDLMLGIAYDREISTLGSTSFNNGSVEVFLRYELLSKSKSKIRGKYGKVLTPRFF
ncbi:type IX secretion system membrane protein PorP/SprF [Maribacter sp. R77961]|uniref:type IX secretion system membrane protein PorP/SprF n=1 Tax=Maribacter sp. R77961 TaxID=3093871 RepID=UPI0037C76228